MLMQEGTAAADFSAGNLVSGFQKLMEKVENRMLPPQKRISVEQAECFADLGLTEIEANRRCIGVLPLPPATENHELLFTHNTDSAWILETLVKRRFSGCLRLLSEKRKLRAAVLFFEGRVLGSVYTQEQLGVVLFSAAAYERIVSDLAIPNNLVDVYSLSPQLIKSAAALFHSPAKKVEGNVAVCRRLAMVLDLNISNSQTSTVVVTNPEGQAISVIYVCRGNIEGVYSFKLGWLSPTMANAILSVAGAPNGELIVSTLAHEVSNKDLTALSFRPAEATRANAHQTK
jgi:hypothetical protein